MATTDPKFDVVYDGREISVPCRVIPDLVMCGDGTKPGIECLTTSITGRPKDDLYLMEMLAYQINEGSGMLVDDSGSTEHSDDASKYPGITWNYTAPVDAIEGNCNE